MVFVRGENGFFKQKLISRKIRSIHHEPHARPRRYSPRCLSRRRGLWDGSLHSWSPRWSEPQCECERCKFEADRGRDKEFIRLDYYCSSYDIDILLLRLGRACDAVLAQLPLNNHERNPSNYGDSKVY